MIHTVPVPRSRVLLRPLLVTLAVAVAGLGATACSDRDGRSLPPPEPRQTTTPVSSPVVGQPSEDGGALEVFALFSTAFANGEAIPPQHTCAGADVSPPLDWASPPAASELALVVRDDSANGFVHWVMTGIDPLMQSVGEDGVPESAIETMNDAGTIGWSGPCPPPGAPHTYVFTLHALAAPLVLEPGTPGAEAARLVEDASTAQAVLTGTFQR